MWNCFKSSSADEETVNNAFYTTELFKITSDEQATIDPNVIAIVQDNRTIVAVDSSLFLVEDNTQMECKFLSFGIKIDTIHLSTSGDLIICALTDGNIHGVHVKGIPIFNLTINENDVSVDRTFIGVHQLNNNFYLMCTNGSLYRLHNVIENDCFESFQRDINQSNNNHTFNDTLLTNVLLDVVVNPSINEDRFQNESINTFCLFTCDESTITNEIIETNSNDNIYVISSTNEYIHIYHQDKYVNLSIPKDFGGIKTIYNLNHLILGLSNSGTFFEICLYSKTILFLKCEYLIENMIVLENNGNDIEMLILTKSTDNQSFMKIIDFPTMKLKYELQLMQKIWLTNQAKLSMNIFYLCGDTLNSNVIQEIVMKIIEETEPSERLKKLIHRGLFVEAEDFAQKMELSLQPIYEAKTKKLLIEIGSLKQEDDKILIEEKFNNFLNYIKLIENFEFLVTLRNIEIPERNLLKTFLRYLIDKLQYDTHEYEYNEIADKLQRLETLKLIDPYECNMEWQEFVNHPNLLTICKRNLNTDISHACLIWKHHSSNIISSLDNKSIMNILYSIPVNTEPFHIIQWLKHFIPVVLQTHPSIMSLTVDWCLDKNRSLQYSKLWPDIGIEFCNNIFDIFSNISFLLQNALRIYERNIAKIKDFKLCLEKLCELKQIYNLQLTIDDYINDSIEETALHILQRINLNNIHKLVNNFIYPLFMEKGILPTDTIIGYIQHLIKYRKNNSLWSERSIACIELLHNKEDKLKCVLQLLKAATVPWSEQILSLLKYGKHDHPLSAEIVTEYERQQIKIMKLKYNWSIDSSVDSNMKLVFRIVKMNLAELNDDMKNILKYDSTIINEANFYCCYELARRGHIKKSISYFNSLIKSQQIKCYDKLLNIITNILQDEPQICDESQENLIEFLKCISENINDTNNKQYFTNLLRMHILKKHFKLKTLAIDEHNADELLYKGILYIMNTIKPTMKINYVQKLWDQMLLLIKALEIEQIYGFIHMLKLMNNIYVSCAITKFILELCTITKYNSENFINLAVLLIVQQITEIKQNNLLLTMPISYALSYRLLTEALQIDKIHYIEINELITWIRIGNDSYDIDDIKNYFKNPIELDKNMLVNLIDDYDDDGDVDNNHSNEDIEKLFLDKRKESMSMFDNVKENGNIQIHNNSESIIKCLSLAFKMLLISLAQNNNSPLKRFMNYFNCNNDYKLENVKKEFFSALEELVKIKEHSCAYIIVQQILKYQQYIMEPFIPDALVSILNRKILKYAMTQKEPNFIESMIVLTSDKNTDDCLKYLQAELKSGYKKLNYLTLLEFYTAINSNTIIELEPDASDSRINHYYFNELCKIDATLKYRKTPLEYGTINEFLESIYHLNIDVNLLIKMSNDFKWDVQDVLILQVIVLLKKQELHFDINTDNFDKEEICVHSNVEDIVKLCQPYINKITSINIFIEELLKFFDTINFYFYELYLCVLNIISNLINLSIELEHFKNILLFLKYKMTVKRHNRIGQHETDSWLNLQQNIGVLPKIAKYRFPFKLMIQETLGNILDEEINVENCAKWFPLIKMHAALHNKCSQTEIIQSKEFYCMAAVKNSILEYKNITDNGNMNETWNLIPTNNSFLQSILRLIKHMKDLSKILIVLYYVMNQTPEGADQIEAAYQCYKFVIENENELSKMKRAQETVFKIKRKYPILKTQHLLHLYNLIDDKLLQLIENPKELINALYCHECILKSNTINVNKLVQEIANLHKLNYYTIQMSLLQKWLTLTSDTLLNTMEETFCEDINTTISDNVQTNNDEFILRAHYILSSWEPENSKSILVSHIFADDGNVNTEKQLRVLECFIKIMDDNCKDLIEHDQYVILKCVDGLKQLGFSMSVQKFQNYDKLVILKKIWKSYSNNVIALDVIASICISYNIFVPKIWDNVLKQMINLNMVKQLSSLVEILSTKKPLLHIEGLANAWEFVIKLPFKSANKTKSNEQETILSNSLFLLQSCPVALKINTMELAEYCIRINRPHMAAILIAYSEDIVKENIIKMVNNHKTNTLKQDIMDLEEFGIFSFILTFVIHALNL